MIDLKSVTIIGGFNAGRARVLWHDGMLKAWGLNGLLFQVASERPTKKRGYLARWEANTENGMIEFKVKCVSCGGRNWWRIVGMNHDELWNWKTT